MRNGTVLVAVNRTGVGRTVTALSLVWAVSTVPNTNKNTAANEGIRRGVSSLDSPMVSERREILRRLHWPAKGHFCLERDAGVVGPLSGAPKRQRDTRALHLTRWRQLSQQSGARGVVWNRRGANHPQTTKERRGAATTKDGRLIGALCRKPLNVDSPPIPQGHAFRIDAVWPVCCRPFDTDP